MEESWYLSKEKQTNAITTSEKLCTKMYAFYDSHIGQREEEADEW